MGIIKRLTAAVLLAACVLSFAACSGEKNTPDKESSTAPSGQSSADEESTTEQSLEYILNETNYSGYAYITRENKVMLSKGCGYSDSDNTKEYDETSVFPICSNTQQFTAAAVLLLIQQGKLSVFDTIDTFFPDCKYARDVNIHQLLSMCSGIEDYLGSTDKSGTYNMFSSDKLTVKLSKTASAQENKKAAEKFILESELRFEPGKKAEYSCSNYFLLARIVEIISGTSYEDFITKNFLEPLNMKHTGFLDSYDGDIAQEKVKDTDYEHLFYPGAVFGSGCMVSCASDLAAWTASLVNGTILSKDIVSDMYYFHTQLTDSVYYGYGVFTDGSGEVFFNSGSMSSYSSLIYADNFQETYIILLCNSPEIRIDSVGTSLFNALPTSRKLTEETE